MNFDNQHVVEATEFIRDSFCTTENFEIPFIVAGKIKSIVLHYRSTGQSQIANLPAHSTNMQNINEGIQRRIAKWSSSLSVEFEKLFPNILNGAKVFIDAENLLATCPLCHLTYSIILPGRKNSFYKRNFLDHLKRGHLQTRNPLRATAQHNLSLPIIGTTSIPQNLNRLSLPSDSVMQNESQQTEICSPNAISSTVPSILPNLRSLRSSRR